jgi:hypothetical protein
VVPNIGDLGYCSSNCSAEFGLTVNKAYPGNITVMYSVRHEALLFTATREDSKWILVLQNNKQTRNQINESIQKIKYSVHDNT